MQNKPKRQRLSNKQRWFFNNIFVAGQSVEDVVNNLRIRPSTLNRWLTKPLFVSTLRMYMNHYQLQTRMEIIRNAAHSVRSLAFLTDTTFKHTELRKASNDILNMHNQLIKAIGSTGDKNSAKMDDFGVVLEQFGNVSDNNGALSDNVGNTKSTKNRLNSIKNNDSSENS